MANNGKTEAKFDNCFRDFVACFMKKLQIDAIAMITKFKELENAFLFEVKDAIICKLIALLVE